MHTFRVSNRDEFKHKVAIQGRFNENINKHARFICNASMDILAKKAKH